jgi:hypothetical protein
VEDFYDSLLSARALVSQHGVPKSGLWKSFSGAPTAAFAAVGYLAQGAEVPLGLLQLRLDPPLVPAQEGGHDLTTPRGSVPALSLAEVRAMEPWVPTLEEVLELFQDYPEAVLNAELKSLPGFPSAARALGLGGVHPHKALVSEESLARWKEAGFSSSPGR